MDNSGSDSDDELGPMALTALYAFRRWVRMQKEPRHDSILTGAIKTDEYLFGNEELLKEKTRMNRFTFMSLCQLVQDRGLLRPTSGVSVPEQLFIFLEMVCHATTNRQAQDIWQHSGETISRWFTRVLDALFTLKDEFIRPPDCNQVQPYIVDNAYKYRPWFDDCIGAIDGTHVPCVPPAENSIAWRNRKGMNTQNILAAVSFDLLFTYMIAGWEGSAHDARILAHAISQQGFPIPPAGKFYLADSGYANSDYFLTPYRGETYHLPEYTQRRHGLTSRREVFNYTHSSLRNCIERTFGVWKARFKILTRMNSYPIEKQVKIPIVCAILHNFITIHARNAPDMLLQSYMHDIPSDAATTSTSHTANNVDEVPDEDDDQTADEPQTQVLNRPQNIHGQTGKTRMGRFRENLADLMWERYQQYPWYRL